MSPEVCLSQSRRKYEGLDKSRESRVDAKSRRRKKQGLEEDLRKAIAYLRTVSVVLGSLQLLPRQVMQ